MTCLLCSTDPVVFQAKPDKLCHYSFCKDFINLFVFYFLFFFPLQNVNHQLCAEMRKEKAELLTSLQVKDINEDVTLISEPLISAWYCHEGPYPYQPTLLARPLCQHNLYSPLKCHLLKCVRAEGVSYYAFCCDDAILYANLSEDFRGSHEKLQEIFSI